MLRQSIKLFWGVMLLPEENEYQSVILGVKDLLNLAMVMWGKSNTDLKSVGALWPLSSHMFASNITYLRILNNKVTSACLLCPLTEYFFGEGSHAKATRHETTGDANRRPSCLKVEFMLPANGLWYHHYHTCFLIVRGPRSPQCG